MSKGKILKKLEKLETFALTDLCDTETGWGWDGQAECEVSCHTGFTHTFVKTICIHSTDLVAPNSVPQVYESLSVS